MSLVSCLAIGDPHFMVNNVNEAEQMIVKINQLIKQISLTFVVILGDMLHTHEKIHVIPLKLVTKLITSIARKVPVYVLIGNHDYCNHSQFLTTNHPFNSFKGLPNVTICDRPTLRMIDGLKFVFCPYVETGRFEEALDVLEEKGQNWDDATCIFAHQEFFGCQFNPVTKSVDGDVWPETYPMVVSGHIHNEQRLAPNIYYPGSSMQHSFGETADKIIAYILFDEAGQITEIQRVDLELPKKKIMYLDIEKVDRFVCPANTQVKLVLRGAPEQIKVFRNSPAYKNLQKSCLVAFLPHETKPDTALKIKKQQSVIDILQELIAPESQYVKNAFDNLINSK